MSGGPDRRDVEITFPNERLATRWRLHRRGTRGLRLGESSRLAAARTLDGTAMRGRACSRDVTVRRREGARERLAVLAARLFADDCQNLLPQPASEIAVVVAAAVAVAAAAVVFAEQFASIG